MSSDDERMAGLMKYIQAYFENDEDPTHLVEALQYWFDLKPPLPLPDVLLVALDVIKDSLPHPDAPISAEEMAVRAEALKQIEAAGDSTTVEKLQHIADETGLPLEVVQGIADRYAMIEGRTWRAWRNR